MTRRSDLPQDVIDNAIFETYDVTSPEVDRCIEWMVHYNVDVTLARVAKLLPQMLDFEKTHGVGSSRIPLPPPILFEPVVISEVF